MNNIDEFKSNIHGVAQTNRYNVIINNEYLNAIPYKFMAKEINLPGQSITSASIVVQGSTRNVAAGMDYDPVNITFICDREMKVRKAIEKWQRKIFDKNNYTVGYYDDYKTDIIIEVLDKKFQVVYKIKVTECWPKEMGEIGLSYENNDQVMEFNTTFDHFSWVVME